MKISPDYGWTEINDILYGHNATGDESKLIVLLSALGNTNERVA
jgi:hypothetical protein